MALFGLVPQHSVHDILQVIDSNRIKTIPLNDIHTWSLDYSVVICELPNWLFRFLAIELKVFSKRAIQLKLDLNGRTTFQAQFPVIEEHQLRIRAGISITVAQDSVIVVNIKKRSFCVWYKLATFKISTEDVHQLFSGLKKGQSASVSASASVFTGRQTDTISFQLVELHIFEKGCELVLKFASNTENDVGSSGVGITANVAPECSQIETILDEAVQVVDTQPGSLLDGLDGARDAVEKIMSMVETMAEVHPFAKLASLAVTAAFDHLRKEEQNDDNLVDLAHNMNHTLTFVALVKDRAEIEKLQSIVKEMMELVRNTSHFIIDYFCCRRLERALNSVFFSTAQDQIEEFSKCFEKLRNAFNGGVTVQVLDYFCNFEEDRRLQRLRRVIPSKCRPSYNPDRGCMPGTRVEILKEVIDWVIDRNSQTHMLWLHGLAGTGKSAIACSICDQLNARPDGRQYLGASFFCKRDDKYLRNPTLVLPKIAANLAYSFPAFGKLVAAALRNDPELITTEAISRQFTDLFKGPLLKLSKLNRDPFAVVIDALEEVGTDDDRRHLITIFHEISGLTPWLKIVLTSRPDPDIRHFFDESGCAFYDLDLNTRSSTHDVLTVTKAHMKDIAKHRRLFSDWPGEEKVKAFAERGTPLFIWVDVAATFIKCGMRPDERLDRLLNAESSGSEYKQLDLLYTAAIEGACGDAEDNAEDFRNIMGMVVAVSLHTPLPLSVLMALMKHTNRDPGDRYIDEHAVERIIAALASVLYEDASNNRAIRICHPSFMDFLTKRNHICPERFRIDIRHENTRMATFCFKTMMDEQCGLKFNICGLESSHEMNADVEGLSKKVEAAISEPLRYSSLHWAAHLTDSTTDGEERTKLYGLIKQFFSDGRPLFWLEVLSLLGNVKAAITSLLLVVAWISDADDEYSCRAADLHRFVLAFFDPISQSTPHIYVSALAFSPNQSITSQQLLPLFPHVLTLTRGQKPHWSTCLRTFDGHSGRVWSVALSKDGKRAASGSDDKTIRIWDVETGTMVVGSLQGHAEEVISVAFSPDGHHVVSGSLDRIVRLWHIESGAAIKSLQGHHDSVFAVAFSPDGKHVASGSSDQTVRIWDIDKDVAAKVLEGHDMPIYSVAFSPDGLRVASGSEDCTIRIWNIEKSELILGPLRGHQATIRSVAFSPCGQSIVSASHDKTIRIWNSETGVPLVAPLVGHTGHVLCAAFSPADNRFIVSSGGIGDKTIRIWDAEVGTLIGEPLVGHNRAVCSVVFTPDGRYIVSGSEDKTIRIWDMTIGATIEHIQGHESIIWAVALSPNGEYIASGGVDKSIRIWDSETGAMIGTCLDGHRDQIYSIAFSSDGMRIASGAGDKTVRIWNVETHDMVGGPFEGHDHEVRTVAFSLNRTQLASGSLDKTIRIWDWGKESTCKVLEGHGDAVRSVAFSPNLPHLASSSDDKTIRIWNTETGSIINVFNEHDDPVNSVAFSPDGRRLVSGSADQTVRIWDSETGKHITLPAGHTDAVFSVTFSLDGQRVISGSRDCSICIWNVNSPELGIGHLEGHINTVTCVASLPDGRIVSSSRDHTIRIWTVERQKAVACTFEDSLKLEDQSVNPFLVAYGQSVVSRMTVPTADKSAQVMDDYGWITQSGNALLWVPADYRQGFIEPAIIIPHGNLSINYDNFLHGPSWVDIRQQPSVL